MHLSPLTNDEWPSELAHFKDSFTGSGNVYRVMAHHPALLAAWSNYRTHVVLNNSLGEQRSEITILRIGHRLGSPYEWAHHVVRGRKAGLSDKRILSMRGSPADMAPEDATIARSVDALIDNARLSAADQQALSNLVGKQGMLDVMATVGLYSTLAFIVNSFDTPTDEDILTSLAENPIE